MAICLIALEFPLDLLSVHPLDIGIPYLGQLDGHTELPDRQENIQTDKGKQGHAVLMFKIEDSNEESNNDQTCLLMEWHNTCGIRHISRVVMDCIRILVSFTMLFESLLSNR